jgi:hypothetical protein
LKSWIWSFTLWNFPTFPNFFPSTTITLMSGTRDTNNLTFLSILISRILWVLPVSISTTTSSFFICPFNLRVFGWVMHVMVMIDILGVFSSMRFQVSFWQFSISSFIDSIESDSSCFYASQVYNFYDLSSIWHLCIVSHFSPHCLYFPYFILWEYKLILLYSRRLDGMYLSFPMV